MVGMLQSPIQCFRINGGQFITIRHGHNEEPAERKEEGMGKNRPLTNVLHEVKFPLKAGQIIGLKNRCNTFRFGECSIRL